MSSFSKQERGRFLCLSFVTSTAGGGRFQIKGLEIAQENLQGHHTCTKRESEDFSKE
jgi:hypothetical protein